MKMKRAKLYLVHLYFLWANTSTTVRSLETAVSVEELPSFNMRGSQKSTEENHSAGHDQNMFVALGLSKGEASFVKATQPGSLGTLPRKALKGDSIHRHLLMEMGGSGMEMLTETGRNVDSEGQIHVRYQQRVKGFEVEGAAVVVHTDEGGNIQAMSGELVPLEHKEEDFLVSLISRKGSALRADTEQRLEQALVEAQLSGGQWDEKGPELTIVRRAVDGTACLAWKQLYRYHVADSRQISASLHADMIFADALSSMMTITIDGNIFGKSQSTGTKPEAVLCANHPKLFGSGIPSMETYDCSHSPGNNCSLVSQEAGIINTGDTALDAAHNYALATYNYYWNNFGRDSMDGVGMRLRSRVHYGINYNNAFWDGTQVTYGDGDGVMFVPLSLGLDIVAHELTHAVTSSSSKLVYRGESGALNEAMSDIFAALVEREEGGSDYDIWSLGEAIYTPDITADALRSISDPVATGGFDYYPTRYKGDFDYGGVHANSGIANLAFYLLVNGGVHPRQRTNITVPAIGFVNAAYIFYHANVDCLTPSSTFYMARMCTAEVFGGKYLEAVHLAWDAVGVPRNPSTSLPLTNGMTLDGQDAAYWQVLRYVMQPIDPGDKVHCSVAASNGDADLFLRFDEPADLDPRSTNNECFGYSLGSFEDCVTGIANKTTTLHVAIHAFRSFSNLNIECASIHPGTNQPSGSPSIFNESSRPTDTPPGLSPVVMPTTTDTISNDDN